MLPTRGEASASMLHAFRSLLASLRFDPTRACDETGEIHLEPPRSAAAAPAPAPAAGFDVRKAMSGCGMIQQLFVDVVCLPAKLDGRDAWIVSFQKGDKPAATYLERHRDRIAGTWCWEAREHQDAPPLLFTTEFFEKGASDDIREYSCATSGWTTTVRRDRVKVDL